MSFAVQRPNTIRLRSTKRSTRHGRWLREGVGFRTGEADPVSEATATSSSAYRGRQVVGTVVYMSPEQARDGIVDARTKFFGAEAGLYELATGRPAFSHAGREVAEERGLGADAIWST